MADNRISEGSRWEALKSQWLAEKEPDHVVAHGEMYQVIRPEGEPIFIPCFGESMYSSTSVTTKTPGTSAKAHPVAAKPAPKPEVKSFGDKIKETLGIGTPVEEQPAPEAQVAPEVSVDDQSIDDDVIFDDQDEGEVSEEPPGLEG